MTRTDTKRRQQRVLKLLSKTPPSARKASAFERGLESAEAVETLPHLDDINQRVDDVVRRMPRDEIADPAEFERALSLVFEHAEPAYRNLAAGEGDATLSHNQLSALEAVVEADGSRPSLLLRDGVANADHPLSGKWRDDLVATRQVVAQIAPSIGRVEPENGSGANFFGTATVVDSAQGRVLTNWHVVEAMCRRMTTLYEYKGQGRYRIIGGVFIDFAAETGAAHPNRFKVVEAQTSNIDGPDFARLDAAVLRIEPVDGRATPRAARFVADPDGPRGSLASMCIIGHPGRPAEGSGVETIGGKTIDWAWVNAALFGNRYGLKRISPGEVDTGVGSIEKALDPRQWVFGHDATSLGGSSGCPSIAWKDGGGAFGLHFAGATLRANYAHAISVCAERLHAMGVPVAGGADEAAIDEQPVRDLDRDAHTEARDATMASAAPALEAAPPWRVARALLKLREQVDAKAPKRSKASDGTIGDLAHSKRPSDHNPRVIDAGVGVVTAMDITHDPARGCDADALANAIVASRDPRVKYIIWNRKIISSSTSPWAWRPYAGVNHHTKHVHISVEVEKAQYDDPRSWRI